MWLHRLTSKQKKAYSVNHQKMIEADNERAVNHPERIRKSYSATHKPYDRTNYGDLNRRSDEK